MNYSWLITATLTSIRLPLSRAISLWPGALLFSICLFPGCSQPEEKESKKLDPVVREDAEKFRGLLEKAIDNRDNRTFVELFAKTALFDRVFAGLELKPSSRRRIEARINRGGNINNIAMNIFERLDRKKGSYEFVRIEETDGDQTLIYRLDVIAEPETEYHRYHLTRTPRGKVRACDVYSFLENDSLAKQLRRKVIQLMHAEDELDLKLQQEFARELTAEPTQSPKFQKLAEIIIEEDWTRALQFSKSLPPEIRDTRLVQLQRLLVAERLGMEPFDAVLAEFREAFPDDILKEFHAIRFYRKHNANQKLIAAVDRVMDRVQDPYLQHLKLDALIEDGELQAAGEILEVFKEAGWLPEVTLLHQLEWSAAKQDFKAAIDVMQIMKEKHGLEIDNIDSLPQYAELIKSQEYKEWKASLDQ